jgi:hypothetical protein
MPELDAIFGTAYDSDTLFDASGFFQQKNPTTTETHTYTHTHTHTHIHIHIHTHARTHARTIACDDAFNYRRYKRNKPIFGTGLTRLNGFAAWAMQRPEEVDLLPILPTCRDHTHTLSLFLSLFCFFSATRCIYLSAFILSYLRLSWCRVTHSG